MSEASETNTMSKPVMTPEALERLRKVSAERISLRRAVCGSAVRNKPSNYWDAFEAGYMIGYLFYQRYHISDDHLTLDGYTIMDLNEWTEGEWVRYAWDHKVYSEIDVVCEKMNEFNGID